METAEREFSELLASRPNHPAVLSNLGLLRLIRRRPAEAERVLIGALAADPKNPRPRYLLGRSRLGAGRPEDAVKAFQEAAEREPGEADIWFRLSEALLAGGREPAARKQLRKVLELNPRHGPALYRLGRSLVAAGRKTEGEALLGRFAEQEGREGGPRRPFRYDEPLEPFPSAGDTERAGGHWLEVRAASKEPARNAVVTVFAGKLILRKEAGANPVRFELGERVRADSIKADWPDGTHAYRVGAEAGETIVLSEVQAHVW